ncbi:porin [Streptococcus pneumoniae]|nr:porin [Streptococcus pneumoniae]
MKKFVAELIGMFMLVFVGTGAVVFGHGLDGLGHRGIAFDFGLALSVINI